MNLIVNGRPEQVPGGLTAAELLTRLKLPPQGVAVELNGQIVPRARLAETELHDGDKLEVVSLVGGG